MLNPSADPDPPREHSELDQYHNRSVLVRRAGKGAFANLDTRLFRDQPCLIFPEDGTWKKVEPYRLTDADIDALIFDPGSRVIYSPLAFDI
jgi:hypothetical protein